jgi:hypothetical protein
MVPDQQFRIIDALMWNHDAARTVVDIKPAGRLNASPPRIPITPSLDTSAAGPDQMHQPRPGVDY